MTSTEISNANKIMLGSTEADKVYIGSNQIWSKSHEYVEINGVKWATMNIGASSVTDSGLYFQWGDTQGYTASQIGNNAGQKYFGLADYKYGNGESSNDTYQVTKYTGGYNDNNFIDDKTQLSLSDDGARAYWGSHWRMPTAEELFSLGSGTTREWVDNYQGSGVSGCLLKQYNDPSKYIFLPAAGTAHNGRLIGSSSAVYIWSKSLYLYNAKYGRSAWIIDKEDHPNNYYDFNDQYFRNTGFPIRAVYDEHTLPAGYTELEYISSTNNGNQYIDLGIKLYDTLNKDYDIAIKFMISSTNAQQQATMFNCQDPNNSPWPGTFIRKNNSGVDITGRYIGGTAKDNTIGQLNQIIELPVQTPPNKNVTNLNNNNSTHQYGAGLFCSFSDANNTPQRYCNGTLYYFKLFVGGTLVRDLIPCKNSNNVVGMYDVVNNVFYTSPNGNAFVAGPAV